VSFFWAKQHTMKKYYFHDNPTLDFSINKGISPKISIHIVERFDKRTGLQATIVAWSKERVKVRQVCKFVCQTDLW
jgi:hypothetical protein